MRSLIIYLKTVLITSLCLLMLCAVYIGVCDVYEAMRERLYSDNRSAVIIGENYFKFFDKEIYFLGD